MNPSPTSAAAPPGSTAKNKAVQGLVSEFMAEKKRERDLELAVQARKAKRRVPTLVAGSVACLTAWVAPLPRPGRVVAEAPAGYTMASGRVTLQLAASRVRAFRDQKKRLPPSLEAAGVRDPGVMFQPGSEGQFTLRVLVGQTLLTYDSAVAPTILQDDIQAILNQTGR